MGFERWRPVECGDGRRDGAGRNPRIALRRAIRGEAVRECGARFERAWPHLYGALQQRARLVRFSAARQNGGQLEVGVEIVRVGGELFAECLGGAVGVAGEQKRLAVVRVERRHVRIQGRGLGKLRDGARIVAARE